MEVTSKLVANLAAQNLPTAFAFGIEATITYTAMPMLMEKLSPTIYTTIVFVIGGGVGFIATYLTRSLFKTQKVSVMNSIKEEKVRGAIYMALLAGIGLLALALRI
ncbi:MAG TPA: hypothetical protein VLV31_01860 [Candidatus Acidoferrales bacterium]|nr:hypothetical protein [Candidatus Acidoferrales bacterium]